MGTLLNTSKVHNHSIAFELQHALDATGRYAHVTKGFADDILTFPFRAEKAARLCDMLRDYCAEEGVALRFAHVGLGWYVLTDGQTPGVLEEIWPKGKPNTWGLRPTY